jgi:hypothetical protein
MTQPQSNTARTVAGQGGFILSPLLVIVGEGDEELALCIDGGFVVALKRTADQPWIPMTHMPPKLMAYVDTFMAQHFHLLNNRYGMSGNDGNQFN